MNERLDESKLKELVARVSRATEAAPPEIRSALAAELLRVLLSHERESHAGNDQSSVGQQERVSAFPTLSEAIASAGNRTHAELLALISAHRLRIKGVDSLTTQDFEEAYRETRWSRPQNLSDTVAKAIRRGWLVLAQPRGGQRAWRVTASGLRQVETFFQ